MSDYNYIFDEIKRTYNLIDYAQSIGYVVNKSASAKNPYSGKIVELRMLDAGGQKTDEILVKYINSKWYYRNRFDDSDWGSIIDFVGQKVLHTENIHEIINYLTSDSIDLTKIADRKTNVPTQEDSNFQLPEDRLSFFELEPYDFNHSYLNKRGINDEIIKDEIFKNCILMHPYKWKNGATGKHVAFPILDQKHNVSGALIKNRVGDIIINRMLKHSDNIKSLFLSNYPKTRYYGIFITETPIEAISYYQIYNKKYLFIATMGSHTPDKYEMILNETNNPRFSGKIVLANNKDYAGILFNMQLLSIFQSKTGVSISSKLSEDKKSTIVTLKIKSNKKKIIDTIENIVEQEANYTPDTKDYSSISFKIEKLLHQQLFDFQTIIINIYQPIFNIVISVPFNNDYNDDLTNIKS